MTPNAPALELLPAVDVQDGQAVRLVQGEAGSATSYGDPVTAALDWQRAGAEWIHLVDLDAAFGRGDNREVMRRVVEEIGVKIELSGGIRDDASLENALEMGAARVNLGTAALEDPEWTARVIERFGDRVAVGLDVRGTTLAAPAGAVIAEPWVSVVCARAGPAPATTTAPSAAVATPVKVLVLMGTPRRMGGMGPARGARPPGWGGATTGPPLPLNGTGQAGRPIRVGGP